MGLQPGLKGDLDLSAISYVGRPDRRVSLTVSSSDLEYLTPEEAEQIIDRFKKILQSSDKLLF